MVADVKWISVYIRGGRMVLPAILKYSVAPPYLVLDSGSYLTWMYVHDVLCTTYAIH
jgi:hypothetical protein